MGKRKPIYAPVVCKRCFRLETRKDLPVNNFKEFVAYTKEHQAQMQFASAGIGSAVHLGCVLLNYVIDVNVTHVPYRGSAPALQDLEAGRDDYMCDIITTAKPPIDAGVMKGIATLDTKRSPALPNIPTAAEQGTPGIVAYTWNGIFLPKNAPNAIAKKIHAAALEAMHTQSVRDKLTAFGAELVSDQDSTPQHLDELVKSEITKWAGPIKAAGVTVE
jgi:tripartite-type tricarboxylate transporter receptor subunit TctC